MKNGPTPSAVAIATVAAHFVVAGDDLHKATRRAKQLLDYASEVDEQDRAYADWMSDLDSKKQDLKGACAFIGVKQPRSLRKHLEALWNARFPHENPNRRRSLERFWNDAVAGKKVFSLELLGAIQAIKGQSLSERNAKVAEARSKKARKQKLTVE